VGNLEWYILLFWAGLMIGIILKSPRAAPQGYRGQDPKNAAEGIIAPQGGSGTAVPRMHASAPKCMKCADCTMDREACPTCYAAWWKKRHPNVHQVG
jgi:hypothetical protein